MKRIIAIALLLTMIFGVCVYAAGKATVSLENYISVDSWGTTSYAFAKLENTGDKPIEYSAGLFEVYDENGDTLESTSYLNVYGEVLQPGEYAYVKASVNIDNAPEEVADYMLTVTAKNGSDSQTLRFPCEAEWLPDNPTKYFWTENVMSASFTNTTDETLFDVSICFALLDEEGNILYIDDYDFYDSVGITPGSTVVVHSEVYDSILEAWEAAGTVPASVDAYAYIELD